MTLLTDTTRDPSAASGAAASGAAVPPSAGAPLEVPPYDPHSRLSTRQDLDERVEGLLPTAVVRQLWLLLFDADDVQMPAMIPIGDLPLHEGDADGEGIGELLTTLDREFGVASYVFVLERPGSPDLTADDRKWLAYVLGLADGRPFAVRAAYLCHDDGVTQYQRDEVDLG